MMRFLFDGVPERDRHVMVREFFGRQVIGYDIEPLPDVPLELDIKVQPLPGVVMMWGRFHGSHNRRTREMLAADTNDDLCLIVNLRGPHRVTYGRKSSCSATATPRWCRGPTSAASRPARPANSWSLEFLARSLHRS